MLATTTAVKMIADAIPFMTTAVGAQHLNKTRIVESVIIGVILSAGGYFIALPVLMEKVESINRNIARLEERVIAVEAKMEIRRAVRDEQFNQVKGDINQIKVDQARRK